MTLKQIQLLLRQTTDSYERERLQQLLHYMHVEGIERTEENYNGLRTNSKRPKNSYKPPKKSTCRNTR